jgi:hypothetical protein
MNKKNGFPFHVALVSRGGRCVGNAGRTPPLFKSPETPWCSTAGSQLTASTKPPRRGEQGGGGVTAGVEKGGLRRTGNTHRPAGDHGIQKRAVLEDPRV